MGYIRHKAIVFTSSDLNDLCELEILAGQLVSVPATEIVFTPVNCYYSFMVGPDGSKEGWKHSNRAEKDRAKLIEEAERRGVDFALVRFGGDEPEKARLEDHNGKGGA